jgi:hypothetical protein
VVVPIAAALGHLAANSFERPPIAEEVFDNVAISVRAAFELTVKERRWLLAVFVVKPNDVVHVVVVHDKPPSFFRNFALGVFHVLDDFTNLE